MYALAPLPLYRPNSKAPLYSIPLLGHVSVRDGNHQDLELIGGGGQGQEQGQDVVHTWNLRSASLFGFREGQGGQPVA